MLSITASGKPLNLFILVVKRLHRFLHLIPKWSYVFTLYQAHFNNTFFIKKYF